MSLRGDSYSSVADVVALTKHLIEELKEIMTSMLNLSRTL